MPVKNIKGQSQIAFKMAIFEGIKQSRTAHTIWTWLEKEGAKREFDVMLLDPGENFGQMLTEGDQSSPDAERGRARYLKDFGGDTLPRPAVLWNPRYDFEYYGDVAGVTVNASGDMVPEPTSKPGGYHYQYKGKFGTQKIRVVRVTRAFMPAWIVLFHELGHVKQYFEGGDLAAWKSRLGDTNGIEAENLAKHENPMCVETKKPVRAHYKHNVYGFDGLVQAYGTGQKINAWKQADTVGARAVLEASLKSEATLNSAAKSDAGIYFT